jgi:hypothetical protein
MRLRFISRLPASCLSALSEVECQPKFIPEGNGSRYAITPAIRAWAPEWEAVDGRIAVDINRQTFGECTMARKTETTTNTTKPASQAASPPVTFDVNDPAFQAIVAQAVAARLAAIEAEKPAKMSIAGKSEQSIRNEIAVVKAFKKAGFGNVTPHQDVKTFNKWMAEGRRPIEGSKSLKIKNLRLFHKSQTRPVTAAELKATKEQQNAAIKRHEGKGAKATVTPLHPQ